MLFKSQLDPYFVELQEILAGSALTEFLWWSQFIISVVSSWTILFVNRLKKTTEFIDSATNVLCESICLSRFNFQTAAVEHNLGVEIIQCSDCFLKPWCLLILAWFNVSCFQNLFALEETSLLRAFPAHLQTLCLTKKVVDEIGDFE